MAYNVVFVIYQVVIVLLLCMPNVNCQAGCDIKHFLKAWLDLLQDKLSYGNQIWKATSVDCYIMLPFWIAGAFVSTSDATETMLYYM